MILGTRVATTNQTEQHFWPRNFFISDLSFKMCLVSLLHVLLSTFLLPFYQRLNCWAYQDCSNSMSIGPERQQGYQGMNASRLHVL